MLKKLLSVLLTLALLLSLIPAGYAADIEIVDEPEDNLIVLAEEEESLEIKVWVSDLIVEHTQQKIQEFNETQSPARPIHATVESVNEGEAYESLMAAGDDAPDLFIFPQDQMVNIVRAGFLDRLDAEAEQFVRAENAESVAYAAEYHGELFAYPVTADNGFFMYYDKSVVPETDLDSLDAIVADCQTAGKSVWYEATSGWYLSAFFFGAGCVSAWEPDGDGWVYADTFNSAQGLVAAKALKKLTDSGAWVDSSDGSRAFGEGAAVLVSGTWNYYQVQQALGENFGATDLPSFTVDGTDYHMGSFSGCKLLGVKPQEDDERRAVLHEFAQYLAGEEAQLERYDCAGWGPSNLAAQQDPAVQGDPALAALLKQSAYATPQGQIPGNWWEIARILSNSIQNAGSDDELWAALETYSQQIEATSGSGSDPDPAYASGQCGDDLTWVLDGNTLTISGTGDMWDFEWSDDTDATTAPWAEYIDQIKTLVLDEGVTSIGNEAFDGFLNLTSVQLSDTVSRLGEFSLQSIGVVSLYLPAGVTEIEDYAIYLCNNLTEITVDAANPAYCSVDGVLFTKDLSELISYPIARSEAYEVPDGVTTISSGAFQRCTGLSAVSFPASLKVIEWGAFQSCSGLTELILPEGFTELGTYAFTACTGMKSAVLPQSLTEIGERAFQSCTALEDLTVSDRLERIGPYAFCNCNSLKSFVIPDSVTTIDHGAIAGCDSLAAFVVSASNPSFSEVDGVLFTKDRTELVQYPAGKPDSSYSAPLGTELIRHGAFFNSFLLTSVTLPEGLIEIGDWAFEGCTDLAEISLPKNLQRIGYSAFAGCENLTEITLPEGLGELDEWVFDECDKLTTVIIEEGLTRIGNAAFYNCDSLSTVVLPDSLLYIGEWSFGHSTKLQTIELPANLVRVEDYAFYGCTSIDHAVFPASLEAIGDWSFSLTSITEMRFLGSAPAFGNGCFDTVTATAYYPENDPSWTEDVRQDYGGSITWVAYAAEPDLSEITEDYTKGAASVSYVETLESGETVFTVSSEGDQAVLVAVKNGDTYTVLKCTTDENGEHRFTAELGPDSEIVIAFKGDTNLNGKLEMRDATLVSQVKNGTYTSGGGLSSLTADINGNGRVETRDATLICQARNGAYTAQW